MEKNSLKAVLYSSFALKKTVVSLSKERERERGRRGEEGDSARFLDDGEKETTTCCALCLSPLSYSFEGKKGSGVEEEEEEIIS